MNESYAWSIGKHWEPRAKAIAAEIPSGSSVVDFGAGYEGLCQYCELSDYLPLDRYKCTERTVYADFNTGECPQIDKFDYAVCQGIIEYIEDVPKFLMLVKKHARNFLITYKRQGQTEEGKNKSRFNYFNINEFEHILFRCKFKLKRIVVISKSELLYFLTK